MSARRLGIALALCLWATPLSAELRLYDDATLAYWATITPVDIRRVLDEDLRPALTPNERRRLADVALEFPMRCPVAEQEPFCYYQQGQADGRRRVVMSVASLRLFGDLALATAWLQREGYSLETPARYVALLRHRRAEELPGGRYPLPLPALGVPESVRDREDVMALYGKLYTSAIVFVLLHELGHALYRHPGYGPGVSRETARNNEGEADAFALDVMARLAYPPLGMGLFFTLMVHGEPNRWHFADEAAWHDYLASATHPLTADRLRRLAEALAARAADFSRAEPDAVAARARMTGMARELDDLAEFMEDADIQAGIVQLGRAADPAILLPRRAGELALDRAVPPGEATFAGTFEGHLGDGDSALPVLLVLERRGDRVQGIFTYGLGLGEIEGEVHEGRLHYAWRLGLERGLGIMETTQDGQRLHGRWGREDAVDDGGRWTLQRLGMP